MKKVNIILLVFSFVLSGIGGIFLFGASATQQSTISGNAPVENVIEYTCKTFDDFFVDNNIPTTKADIAKTTITGSGSQEDPYIINSSSDFYYAINVDLLQSKYVELNCDIYLNDETFDQDGNPSGGDGCYYQWTGDTKVRNSYINGKGHTIYGLYRKTTGSFVGLFGYIGNITYIPSISNLNMADFYIEGDSNVYAYGQNVTRLTNCSLLSGYLKGNEKLSGFANNASIVENCTNYTNLGTAFVGTLLKKMTNCKNYENLTNTGRYVGVFAGSASNGAVIQDCVNYGDIVIRDFSGGFVGQVHGDLTLSNCVNYGSVTMTYARCGGFVGIINGQLDMFQCKNYGKMYCVSQVCGVIGTGSEKLINIINCEFSPETWTPVSTLAGNSKTLMEKCVINAKGITTAKVIFSNAGNLDINNLQVNVNTNNGVMRIISDPKTYLYNIKNVVFNFIGETMSVSSYLSTKNWTKMNCESLIITGNIEEVECYYGSNFSGYYFSWRTGQIGLVALDGRGSFQGVIDEEWLLKNGYEKREV